MMPLIIALAVGGALVSLVGSVMFLVVSFRQSVLWGVAVLLIPFASLVFLFKFWAEAKTAFMVQLFGFLLAMLTIPLGWRSMAAAPADSTAAPPFPAFAEKIAVQLGSLESRMSARGEEEEQQEEGPTNTGPVYIGKTLAEVKVLLGEPKGVIVAKGRTTYFYPNLEIATDDGVRVSYQGVPTQEMNVAPPAE